MELKPLQKRAATEIKAEMTQREHMVEIVKICPEAVWGLDNARRHVPRCKREVDLYEAAALYMFASSCNQNGSSILEIGTAEGYSAAVMASAAPEAKIITLNPKEREVLIARRNLKAFDNVHVLCLRSWDYEEFAKLNNLIFDLIFVDGDHDRVHLDLSWWDQLKVGGIMIFHDYAPKSAKRRPCAPVYKWVNLFVEWLGRPMDILIKDEYDFGLAVFFKDDKDPQVFDQEIIK